MNLAGKKVACFVALSHHTRFLVPICEEIIKNGGEVIFFLPLSDYPFERELTKRNYPFKYIQDYIGEEEKIKIKAAYTGLLDTWSEMFNQWDGVKTWPLYEQERSLSSCIEECFCIESFFKIEQPDLVFALHERNRWGKIIGYHSNKMAIPFITLQEGDYHESRLSFCAHTEYSTANLLWGCATRDTLVEHLCSEDKIVIVGNTHIDSAIKYYSSPKLLKKLRSKHKLKTNKKIVLILVDLEYGAIIEPKIWKLFLENSPKNIQFVFKWHPNVKLHTYRDIKKMITAVDPNVRMMYTEDSYELVALSDYCVTLGKTTLALEAIAFGKPLFAVPSWTSQQEYYADKGVAQTLKPLGNWDALIKTIEVGVPDSMQAAVDSYLESSFYKLDGKAVTRVIEISNLLINKRRETQDCTPVPFKCSSKFSASRISFVLPTGLDAEAFVATVTSLDKYVQFNDWELVIVNHAPESETLLSGLGGDVKIIDSDKSNLSELYNLGAAETSGDIIIFIQPGILFARGNEIPELAKKGLVAFPISDVDMKPYCNGISFDFNYTPVAIKDENHRVFAASGVLAISREHFSLLGGFDESLNNRYSEIDLSLTASHAGMTIIYDKNDLFVHYKNSFNLDIENELWQGRLGFFSKWLGKLPKDDNFAEYAKKYMQI